MIINGGARVLITERSVYKRLPASAGHPPALLNRLGVSVQLNKNKEGQVKIREREKSRKLRKKEFLLRDRTFLSFWYSWLVCISGSYILAIYNIHILHNDYIILIMKAGEDTGETQTDRYKRLRHFKTFRRQTYIQNS